MSVPLGTHASNSLIGLIGASGYSGVQATRILASHPRASLAFAASDRWKGRGLKDKIDHTGRSGGLTFCGMDEVIERSKGCAAVLLATPAEVSLEWAPRLLELGVKVVDLSGAFRLKDPALYRRFYNFVHPQPALLDLAVYGLPELWREEIQKASLLANPGCYPTGATLSLAPLLSAGLLEEDSVVIDAASGTTGAGRRASEELSFTEVDEEYRAYRVFTHQHTPEIAQTLRLQSSPTLGVTFTAHLLPLKRGILATAYARLKDGVAGQQLQTCLKSFAADRPFISVAATPEEVQLKRVVGTNRVLMASAVDPYGFDPRRVIVISAIDNLVKGAAGQAVQNLNLMMGWEESDGLTSPVEGGYYP